MGAPHAVICVFLCLAKYDIIHIYNKSMRIYVRYTLVVPYSYAR